MFEWDFVEFASGKYYSHANTLLWNKNKMNNLKLSSDVWKKKDFGPHYCSNSCK